MYKYNIYIYVCVPHIHIRTLFVSNHTQQSDAIPFTNTRSSGKELMMRAARATRRILGRRKMV